MDVNRGLSGLIALGYLAAAWREAGAASAVWVVPPLALLVWLIWHAETAAAFTGAVGLPPLRRASPPGLVRALAWALLLAPLAGMLAGALGAGA
jgi:hypothetical protein